jgi:hypothetical protein
MHRFAVVALALAAYGGWHWWTTERAVDRPPGILVPDEPVQVIFDDPSRFEAHGYTYFKRAKYDITARLLRKEIYRIDGGAGLAPVDLGVGWGPLYFPKGTDLSGYSQAKLNAVARRLNERPRKTLTFETPAERFHQTVASIG